MWKSVEGFEGIYEVSNKGNVKSLDRTLPNVNGDMQFWKGKLLSFHYSTKRYKRVQLGSKARMVHQLVAKAFVPNPENKPQVNHIDGDKENNSADNLEWVTMRENLEHAWENGLRSAEGLNTHNSEKARVVNQYTLEGQFIRSFESLQEAARITNTSASNIREVCLGKRKKSKGFTYQFA